MKRILSSVVLAGTIFLMACEGPVGPVGLKSLTNVLNEPGGVNCQYGGLKIEVGVDENKNDLLESSEVNNTNYVCNGQPGTKSLMTVTAENPGTNCTSGGYKLESGSDVNNNNVLDASEIGSAKYICNGNGSDGFDKVTVLDFGYAAGTASSDWTIAQYGGGLDLYNFNISNYPGVDSVVFIAFLGTYDINSKCFIELFNKTDNVPINNSILESNRFVADNPGQPPYEMKQTGNIYHDLPKNKEITLTYRIKSETQDVQVLSGFSCYLYLYKR
jgi:hypothetical protein